MENIRTPADLDGVRIGPVTVDVTRDRVALYVEATGDDPEMWSGEAPPGFGAVLLFAVADRFLNHPKVVPFTRTLLHLDQTFEYSASMSIGASLGVEGVISRVRERSGSYFVTFDATATDGGRTVVSSRSTFVLSDQQAPAPSVERPEPPPRTCATVGGGLRSASRHDLVRYAAATRDFNPLHWDHATAVEAGLPGTVVHGLLMYAWLMQEASLAAGAEVTAAKVRFRSALHPGEQATVSSQTEDGSVRLTLTRDDEQLVTGTATVGRDGE